MYCDSTTRISSNRFSFWRLARYFYSHYWSSPLVIIHSQTLARLLAVASQGTLHFSQPSLLYINLVLSLLLDNEPRRESKHRGGSIIWASLLCPLQLLQHCSCGTISHLFLFILIMKLNNFLDREQNVALHFFLMYLYIYTHQVLVKFLDDWITCVASLIIISCGAPTSSFHDFFRCSIV
jgi:hypothetical protein